MVKKYSRRGGHGGRRPGAGRPRKKPEPGPFDEFLNWRSPFDGYLDALVVEEPEPPPPPRLTRAEKKARTAELNNTIRQLRKFGWRVPDDEKDF